MSGLTRRELLAGATVYGGTAWLALFFMWVGAMITDIAVDQRAGAVTA